ncbi:MAG: L7Ae/L30e/S12e/Gadd45 family ribosomal protein [Gemmatimonadota bacterium]
MRSTRDEAERLRLLGLARRAGRTVIGTRAVREAARRGGLAGVVLATDATQNARARLEPALRSGGVPCASLATSAEIGLAVGRGPMVAVGITDRALAGRILRDSIESE